MVRPGLRRWLVGFAFLGLAGLAGIGWLGWSRSGARWLVATAARQLPGTLTLAACEGRLADRLVLRGLDYRGPGGDLSVRRLELRWQPLGLLQGEIRIVRLAVDDLALTLPPAAPGVAPAGEKLDWQWPDVATGPLWLRIAIDRLALGGMEVRRGNGPPLVLDRATGRLRWRGGVLTAQKLDLAGPDGRLQGALTLDLRARRGDVQLSLAPAPGGRLQGVPSGKLHLVLQGDDPQRPLRGNLDLAVAWGKEPQLQLATDFALKQGVIDLTRLRLKRAGLAGTAQGTGRCSFSPEGPRLALDLQLAEVDLAPETRFPTKISGRLQGQVDSQGYRGRFDLHNAASGWQQLQLAGRFASQSGGLVLQQLQGDWLRGTVAGDLSIDWQNVPFLQGSLDAVGLDPGALAAAWPGALTLHLDGRLDFPVGRGLQANWQLQLAPSRLRGLRLQGTASGRYADAGLEVERLNLIGRGVQLTARGKLAERLDFNLNARNLAALDMGLAGSGSLQGWLRWSLTRGWAGQLNGRGDRLGYGSWSLSKLELQGRLLPEANQVALTAQVAGLRHGAWTIDQLVIDGEGRIDAHHLALEIHWPAGHGELILAGGWRDGVWRGQLQSVAAEDRQYGRWRLQQAVTLALGGGRLVWSDLVLNGSRGERLHSQGDLQLQPRSGELILDLRKFSLGWLSPWLADADLTGEADGHFNLRWLEGRLTAVDANLAMQGTWSQPKLQLAVNKFDARIAWNPGGLDGTWQIDLGKHGRCSGKVASGLPPQWQLPQRGKVDADWQNLDLTLFNPWLESLQFAGTLAGSARLEWQEDRPPDFHLRTSGTPQVMLDGTTIDLTRADLELSWDPEGLIGSLDLAERAGGHLQGEVESPEPARMGWPRTGTFAFNGGGIGLALAQRWLPEGLKLDGQLDASGNGNWRSGGHFSAMGLVTVRDGRCRWHSGNREIFAPLQAVRLDWKWVDQSLTGNLNLELGSRGSLQAQLELPLPAHFPLVPVADGALHGGLKGHLQEDGLVGSLFPSAVQETRGQVNLDLALGGIWRTPQLSGKVGLEGAGGYLPTLGVRLQDAELQLRLEKDEIAVEAFRVTSGSGVLRGSGSIALQGLVPGAYDFTLQGEKVQALNLPELQLTASPDLEISGRGRKLRVEGSLKIPEALLRGRQGQSPVGSSSDLVIVDAVAAEKAPPPLTVALKVQVELGDHVLVKTEGVDARLEGKVLVTGPDLRSLKGQGRIQVAEGNYATYGVRLAITRGSVVFAGGPVEEPSLDILALRTSGEVKAGVHVTGTPRAPQVKLYSEPTMPDTDVLAYVVLGHPMGSDSGQTSLMMAAAGALLSQGDSAVLQDRLKRRLGIDVIDVQSAKGDTAGSVVTIGKYLSPQLFLSFGQSVFSNASEVGLRYEIGKHWQFESSVGTESGVDLYYRITFE